MSKYFHWYYDMLDMGMEIEPPKVKKKDQQNLRRVQCKTN